MNATAIKNMEDIAKQVLSLNTEKQNEFFETLSKSGFTAEEIETLQKSVSFYKLMTDAEFYNAVKQSLAEQLYKEFNA